MASRIMLYVLRFTSVVNRGLIETCEKVPMVSHVRVFTGDHGTLRAREEQTSDSTRGQACHVPSRFDRYAWKGHYCRLERT